MLKLRMLDKQEFQSICQTSTISTDIPPQKTLTLALFLWLFIYHLRYVIKLQSFL